MLGGERNGAPSIKGFELPGQRRERRFDRAFTALLVCAIGLIAPSSASGLALEQVGSFERPTHVTSDPQDPNRLFVVEQPGRIQLVDDGSTTTFLDIEFLVDDPASQGNHGLFSIAFSPEYAADNLFYVTYSGVDDPDTGADESGDWHLTEFRADGDSADPASGREVLTIDYPPGRLHRGGQLQFGPDGYLYASTGDGGPHGDPFHNAQDLHTLPGKILRIDPEGLGSGEYTVPDDNPYADTPGCADGCDEIWSYGLRNPWRFSFDRLSGDLVIGDVGEANWEEVDFDPGPAPGRGDNFGWNCREGAHDYTGPEAPGPGSPSPECQGRVGTFTEPAFEYAQADGNCAITGGYVVRDRGLPDHYGRYLYTDFCVGELRSLSLGIPTASGDRSEGIVVPSVTSFGQDSACRLYVASLDGPVNRIVEPGKAGVGGCGPPTSGPVRPSGAAEPAPGAMAPELFLHGRKRQNAGEPIELKARCSERCVAATRGRVVVKRGRKRGARADAAGRNRKRFGLKSRTRGLEANKRATLRLRPSGHRARRRIKRHVRRGNRAKAKIKVIAADRAGNSRARRLVVKLTRS